MSWVNKITSGVKDVLKEHLFSILAFLIGIILAGVYFDFVEYSYGKAFRSIVRAKDHILFWMGFTLLLTPGLLLFESHLQYKKNIIIHGIEILVSVVISGWFSWLKTLSPAMGNKTNEPLDEYLTRVVIIYVILAVVGAVYFLYKKSEETFERYFYKAFIGAGKAIVIYGVVVIGLQLIIAAFEDLFFYLPFDVLPALIILGLMGFPAGIYGISHLDEGNYGFFKVLFGYVLPAMVSVAFIVVYAYVIQIVVKWTFPSNEVFRIMTTLFVTGLIVWTAAQGALEGKLLTACRIMPLLFIPFIVVQCICLFMRVSEYGYTGSRYAGLFMIIFEILYELYYLIRLPKKNGIGAMVFMVIPVMAVIFLIVPKLNVYAVVTNSQKKVVDEFIAKVEAGDEGAYEISQRARSAYFEIESDGSIEGKAYLESVSKKYPVEKMKDLFYEYTKEEKPKYRDYSYYKTSVTCNRDVIELKEYKYLSRADTNIEHTAYEPLDITKVPVYNSDNDELLFELDLSELAMQLRKLDTNGADKSGLKVLIEKPLETDEGLFYINSIDISVDRDDESVVESIKLSGYYLYN